MFRFEVYQQRQGATFLLPDKSVLEVEGDLMHIGPVFAAHGAEAIDKAKNLPAFRGWLPSRLEAYPVVGLE